VEENDQEDGHSPEPLHIGPELPLDVVLGGRRGVERDY
jgi:hypothetical protein